SARSARGTRALVLCLAGGSMTRRPWRRELLGDAVGGEVGIADANEMALARAAVEGPGFAVGLLADGVEEAAGMAPLALDDRLRGARDAYQAGVRDMSISVAVNDDIAGPRLGRDAIVVVG